MPDSLVDRWALITGASSGIGAEFARQLAARGMHLVLTARREDRLRELAEELDLRHGAKTELIPLDLSEPDAPRRLWDEIVSRNIRMHILVNNAGFSQVSEVDRASREKLLEMVRLNVAAVTDLTYRALPSMLEEGDGGVINVSSLTGFQPVAYMGVYAASKAYILHLSESLWAELRDRGVHVMALCPGTTRTELFEVAGVSGWLKKRPSHSPERVVRTALRAFRKKRPVCIPGARNHLLTLLQRFLPRKRVVRGSMKYFRPLNPRPAGEAEASDRAD
ncbi:MAG: SDR family NAD(P)-dependent oxidoreductase [Planctomycetota bacterium]|nr:MAG: SDR family NAD(P)-dependent oxidoreductase [Planctomycetota bacterium]REJ91001.1 MAG: SDR family NAD(P)-dependent oxidoreductase [Planctomycetota bacterium]REK31040.1 MAG: SDR family NAD(P)-dependent oxidoreductase [Planctomycetota bacterium]REK36844.1 MAG: SDR family NAD(P)-dependent oxidoreductase [Planctomycetota bacterium]